MPGPQIAPPSVAPASSQPCRHPCRHTSLVERARATRLPGLLWCVLPLLLAAQAPRPTPPTRDPHTPGYVTAKELPDGANAPANADGNFILGPTHNPAPEMTAQEGVPQGTVFNFTMESADSKIYPGIARDAGTFGTPDPADPAKLIVTTSHPAPYTRQVAVYVPKQYVPGTAAPFIVGADGPDRALVHRPRQSDRRAPRAGDDRHLHRQRQRRRAGQRARPGIRHHVRPVRRVRREGSAAAGGEASTT